MAHNSLAFSANRAAELMLAIHSTADLLPTCPICLAQKVDVVNTHKRCKCLSGERYDKHVCRGCAKRELATGKCYFCRRAI